MHSRNQRGRRGFTVVELMISLCVGGIAISSLYAVGAASTRHFREQQRISTTQSSLRSAMSQIKRDLSRAGYLATPNGAANGEFCGTRPSSPIHDTSGMFGTGRLAGVSAFSKSVGKPTELDPDNLNPKYGTVDSMTLMGNYATSGEYMGITVNANANVVTVPTTTQSFTRDFTNWYAANGQVSGTCSDAALQAAFPVGRLVRVRNVVNSNGFAQVDSARCNGATATINLQTQLPGCNANGGWIAPVSTILYHVDNAIEESQKSRLGKNRVAQLRRTELNPANKTQTLMRSDGSNLPVDDRVVLDYVVNFTVDFILRTNNPNTINIVPGTVAEVRANPEYVRGAIVELVARTSEHEPDMDVQASTGRLPPFRVFSTPGAARTRSLRAEIFMPNIALARY